MDGVKLLGCIFTGVIDDVGVAVVPVQDGLDGGWLGWGIVEVWCVVEFGCDGVGICWVVLDVGGGRL